MKASFETNPILKAVASNSTLCVIFFPFVINLNASQWQLGIFMAGVHHLHKITTKAKLGSLRVFYQDKNTFLNSPGSDVNISMTRWALNRDKWLISLWLQFSFFFLVGIMRHGKESFGKACSLSSHMIYMCMQIISSVRVPYSIEYHVKGSGFKSSFQEIVCLKTGFQGRIIELNTTL